MRPKTANSRDPSAPRRLVGYIRVSTQDQADEGISLETQRLRLVAHAGTNGLTLTGPIEDAGISGKTLDRPGMREALRLLDVGEADGLVVVKLDRLTRSLRDLVDLIDRYFDPKARDGRPASLISLGEQIDTSTPMGRLFLFLVVVIAQWERETIVERTRQALDAKRAKGERIGTVPYGWRLDETDPDGSRLVPSESEFVVLDAIRRRRAEGLPIRQIAIQLEAAGIPTRNGRPWQPSTVARLVKRIESEGSDP